MGRVRKDEGIASYYLILGLKRDASEQEIKNRYRELAKLYHPDVNHSPDAGEKFKEINEAYNYLISHVKDKSRDEEIFKVRRTNRTKKEHITNEVLKEILRYTKKDINKSLKKNLQKFMKERNRIIYTAVVKGIKKEMKRMF